ncbi:MAG: hypothetical protein DCC57_18085 [Chloroflexi bacterium]|nr:MAG: hypothetical protein DCC57_18085 [Chloroflexota bacterium]
MSRLPYIRPEPPEPPTREQLLRDLQTSQTQVIRLLQSMAEVQDWQPEPAEWSFRLIAAHLATVEQACHLQRVMEIASGGTPLLDRYANHHVAPAAAGIDESLRQWRAVRRRLIAFVSELSEAQLAYIGIHQAVGPMTVLDTLQELLDQDRGNLRHVCQLIAAYHEEALQTHRV